MLNDRDSVLRKLHELRSEHRDLDTVIARLCDRGGADQLHLQRLKKRKLLLKDEKIVAMLRGRTLWLMGDSMMQVRRRLLVPPLEYPCREHVRQV